MNFGCHLSDLHIGTFFYIHVTEYNVAVGRNPVGNESNDARDNELGTKRTDVTLHIAARLEDGVVWHHFFILRSISFDMGVKVRMRRAADRTINDESSRAGVNFQKRTYCGLE